VAFQKVLKPKAKDFRRLTVTTDGKVFKRSYALYLPRCPKPKRHLIFLPKDIVVQEGQHVEMLWLVASDEQNGKPTKPLKGYHLKHHYTAFLEDRMHDWDIHNDEKGKPYLSYAGSGTRGEVWLIIIIKGDK